jgi:hypothetical protein
MKIKDITIQDIKNKRLWRFADYDESDYMNTEITQVDKISKTDQILHSALLVSEGKHIYPFLISKYYEDGGEVGEFFIYAGGRWQIYDNVSTIKGSTCETVLGFISTLDSHEYQRGSFDNRIENDRKFNHYIRQIENQDVVPYTEFQEKIPKKFRVLSFDEKMTYIRDQMMESERLLNENKISRSNKIQNKLFSIVQDLKKDRLYHQSLKRLLFDENPLVARGMMYYLYDLFPKECRESIMIVSKEDTLDGLVARIKLRELS